MSLAVIRVVLAAGLCHLGIGTTAHAQATHFHSKPIAIPGGTNVDAIAINKKGAILGHYKDAFGRANSFVLSHGVVTTLPSPCGGNGPPCVPIATAINASGAVVGYFYLGNATYSFLWQNGAYVTAGNFWLGVGNFALANAVGINNAGEEFYNWWGTSYPVFSVGYVGFPGDFQPVILPNIDYNYVDSINDGGKVAGETSLGGGLGFVGQDGHYRLLLGPNDHGFVNELFINNSNHIAGALADFNGVVPVGFVYARGIYTIFTFPGRAPGLPVAVQAINNAGRVVGTYTNVLRGDRDVQRAFLYNGSVVTRFGKFSSSDTVHVALNDRGDIVLSDDGTNGYVSYQVTCHGSGC